MSRDAERALIMSAKVKDLSQISLQTFQSFGVIKKFQATIREPADDFSKPRQLIQDKSLFFQNQ